VSTGRSGETRFLLDNTLAPLTFSWGFLDAPLGAVSASYARWQRTILHSVKSTALDLPLAEALRRLDPLDMGSQRVLFLSTRSRWTACFDNGAKGGNPTTFVGELAQRLKCSGVACACIPNTLTRNDAGKRGTWGAVKFTLFAPEPRSFLNIERSIAVINDVRGWDFHSQGAVQDFERVERYGAARIAERLTHAMLEDYCHALGIRLFDEQFYGGPGVVTQASPWFLPKLPAISLSEARRQLGLDD
jgi:hypothetical protein